MTFKTGDLVWPRVEGLFKIFTLRHNLYVWDYIAGDVGVLIAEVETWPGGILTSKHLVVLINDSQYNVLPRDTIEKRNDHPRQSNGNLTTRD